MQTGHSLPSMHHNIWENTACEDVILTSNHDNYEHKLPYVLTGFTQNCPGVCRSHAITKSHSLGSLLYNTMLVAAGNQ